MVLFQSKLNQRCRRRRQPEVIKANDQSSNHMENLTVSGITLVVAVVVTLIVVALEDYSESSAQLMQLRTTLE